MKNLLLFLIMSTLSILTTQDSFANDLKTFLHIEAQEPGATFFYRLLGEETIHRVAPQESKTCATIPEMPSGLYYIWTERDGEPTSNPDRIYRIMSRTETVEIVEYKTQPPHDNADD